MKNLLNPKWLLLINTAPLLVLFSLLATKYQVINSMLTATNLHYWKVYGGLLVFLGIANLVYTASLLLKKREVSPLYALVALPTYILFLYFYGQNINLIIPFNIPQWLFPEHLLLYVGTFVMPTLAYALFLLVYHFTPMDEQQRAGSNFLYAVLIPFSWYMFSQLIMPFWRPVDHQFMEHVVILGIIMGTVLFLFFLIRGIYVMSVNKAEKWKPYALAWKIPITILFPLLGLALNNGLIGFRYSYGSGIFGDFADPSFYVLAVLNGIFLCLPKLSNLPYRLGLFIGRASTFAYTFYFFLVFLPYLPLSVIAILALGSGFLMLTPLVLFVIHINELAHDFAFLRQQLAQKFLWAIAIMSFAIIPLFISGSYLKDRQNLHQALDYLYHGSYERSYDIDAKALTKTLHRINSNKEGGRDFDFGYHTPYLSSWYSWLVLDNLTLSDSKINQMERVFLDEASFGTGTENIQNEGVDISQVSTRTQYLPEQDAWRTWVDLEISNNSENSWISEYATTIELPTGCWISDYYLYVGDRKEMGILAEKKTAMWIFSQIRGTNRDPGLLHYLTGNKVAFRVFPFAEKEVRKTGIEFIHKTPLILNIDQHTVQLGNPEDRSQVAVISTPYVDFIPAHRKTSLDTIQRQPYYHFMLDVSKGKEEVIPQYKARIKDLVTKNHLDNTRNKISLVDSYVETFEMHEDWEEKIAAQSFEGGFYLERAIKEALIAHHKKKELYYPVFVMVTDNMYEAVLDKDFADLRFSFPEGDQFYHLQEDGSLAVHSLIKNPQFADPMKAGLSFPKAVIAYPNKDNPLAFLPNDNQGSFVLREDKFRLPTDEIVSKDWATALNMAGKRRVHHLYPYLAEKEWLSTIRSSFLSRILSPATAYIVVETEAQQAMLLQKQKQVLNGNKSLDLGEDMNRMSEPGFWLLLLLFGAFLLWRKRMLIKQYLSQV